MNPQAGTPVYTLGLQRDFIARHFLIGGDWGAENELHSHHYRLEAILEGTGLDRHGYLVDLLVVEAGLQSIVDRYRDCTLNDLTEFDGLNPSLEHFARLICQALDRQLDNVELSGLTVRLWENDVAWAAYRVNR